MRKTVIEFTPNYLLSMCFACLLIPLRLLLAWITAIILHETAHCLVLWLGKIRIYKIKIGLAGTVIDAEPMSKYLEMICAAAGPLASLMLLIFVRHLPLLAICGTLQASYNLLPLYPLDGWRILNNLIDLFGLPKKICVLIESTILTIVTLFTLYLTFQLHLGPLPLIALLFLTVKQKLSCKHRRKRVQ